MVVLKDKDKISTTVKCKDGSYVWIDSCFTMDHGYETMVFESDSEGNVLDWGECDVEWYDTLEEMQIGHEKMCEKWRTSNDPENEEEEI